MIAFSLVTLALTCSDTHAQDLVYRPKNPAFGGPYLNYQWMLSSAQIQNRFEDETTSFSRDPLADFENSLQRQVLSQLSRELILERFGEVDFTKEGKFDLGDFLIDIRPDLNGITITVFNKLTGDESTITIPSF